jgi:lipopolysaccharide transport system ATP-binding protein
MKPILEIQNISKKFRINHEKQPYLSLRDRFSNLLHSTGTKEDFWALKDVSFEVMPGDTVGIIGKNGAGKSTLLKILSKITPPTSGKIISRGRIASLLEVGTGFHPELSGRENVFLNGSILGMKRAEILSKFDEIVDFAGVERFIDTPLKHYSSGMQLRLAFAVAAFLQNEVLIIDEVLAVGDAEFQKKCLGKMEDVSKSGRTVLFVSHNLYALNQLCEKSIILENGQLIKTGKTEKLINHYLHFIHGSDQSNSKNIVIANNSLNFTLQPVSSIDSNKLEFTLTLLCDNIISTLALFINNYEGFRVTVIDCRTTLFPLKGKTGQIYTVSVFVDEWNLVDGEYSAGLYVDSNTFKGNIDNVFYYTKTKKEDNSSGLISFPRQYRGIVDLKYKVNIQ